MKLALIGAGAIVAAFATPALAQAVVEGPGYCAQYYPKANCQNYRPSNTVTDFYRRDWLYAPYNAFMDPDAFMDPRLHHHHPTHRG